MVRIRLPGELRLFIYPLRIFIQSLFALLAVSPKQKHGYGDEENEHADSDSDPDRNRPLLVVYCAV